MSIDWMDFVWRAERTFRIRVTQEETARAFGSGTVGELYTFILEKMGATRWPHCLGRPVFRRVQAALADVCDVPAGDIAPATDLAPLLPRRRRRAAWARLGRALDLRLPPLVRPRWARELAAHFFLKGVAVLVLSGVFVALGRPAWFLAAALSVGVAVLILPATAPFADRLPAGCATVKGFVRTLLREHYGLLAERERMWHHREVWDNFQAIIAEVLGVPREAVTPEAHFVHDLGVS
jgi:acyl carrier protein